MALQLREFLDTVEEGREETYVLAGDAACYSHPLVIWCRFVGEVIMLLTHSKIINLKGLGNACHKVFLVFSCLVWLLHFSFL